MQYDGFEIIVIIINALLILIFEKNNYLSLCFIVIIKRVLDAANYLLVRKLFNAV